MSGCTWPLAGRLAGRTCGRDLVSPRSSFCAAHHNLNRETTMGRRDEEDEPEEDLDEAEEFEDDDDDEDEPAPRKKAPRAKAAPKPPKKTRAQPSQKGVPKPSPAETRALDARALARSAMRRHRWRGTGEYTVVDHNYGSCLVLRGRRGSRFLLMSGDVTSRKCTGPELVGGVLS